MQILRSPFISAVMVRNGVSVVICFKKVPMVKKGLSHIFTVDYEGRAEVGHARARVSRDDCYARILSSLH